MPDTLAGTTALQLSATLPLDCGAGEGEITLGIILSSAVNTNGRASALTAPHGPSQQMLLRAALHEAALEPQDVHALQMHSNGTPLGDPIEVGAASAVLLQVSNPYAHASSYSSLSFCSNIQSSL